MSPLSERDILRRLERLARVKPEPEATDQALDRVRAQLVKAASQVAPRPPRLLRLIRRPWVQSAAAAVIVVALSLGIGRLWLSPGDGGPVAVSSDAPQASAPVMPADRVRLQALVTAERAHIDALFAAGDRVGLAALLAERLQPESQAAIAAHLAQIGQLEDLPALERAHARWTGAPDQDPFVVAAAAVRAREQGVASAGPRVPAVDVPDFVPEGILSGRVTDSQGRILPGVAVTLSLNSGFFDEVVTDERGIYRFDMIVDAGTYRLCPASTSYLLAGQEADGLDVPLDRTSQAVRHLSLERGCQVEVEVVREDGQPVRDARLIACWMGSDRANDAGQPVRTDRDGRATIGAFAASEIAYQIIALHDEYALQRATVKCSDPSQPAFVQITLRPGRDIAGTVVYADGSPARDVRLVAQPNWWHNQVALAGVPVAPDGSFVLPSVHPGSYSIRAIVHRGAGDYERQVTQMRLPLADGEPLEIVIPGDPPTANTAIRGHLAFVGDARPEAVFLMAYGQDAHFVPRHALDLDTETFALEDLRPGAYTLVFDGPEIRPTVLQDVGAPSEDLAVSLRVEPRPVFQGVVLRRGTGVPVDDFRVALTRRNRLPGLLITAEDTWHRFQGTAGRFTLPAEGPGVYRLQVVAAGFVPLDIEALDTDGLQPLALDLVTGGRIQGVVRDRSGRPVAGAQVELVSEDDSDSSPRSGPIRRRDAVVRTDAEGRFLWEHVPEGTHRLRVEHAHYSRTWSDPVTVWDEQTSGPVELELAAGARLHGTVFDAAGEPAPGVALWVIDGADADSENRPEAGRLATVVTDADGAYAVDGLPGHLCFVQRRDWNRAQGVVSRAVVPESGQTVTLDLGGPPQVHAQLVLDDVPLSHRRVLVADADNPLSPVFRCYGQTDAAGRVSVSGNALGRLGIYVEDQARWNGWFKLGDFEMGRTERDLGTLPGSLTVVEVVLTSEAGALRNWDVRLVAGDPTWGRAVGLEFAALEQAGRHVIDRVAPGHYTVIAEDPTGRRSVRSRVEVSAGTDLQTVTLAVPTGTAQLSGVILEPLDPAPWLYSADGRLALPLVTEDAFYTVDRLPAGDYFIGNPYLRERAPLVRFHLGVDQRKVVDIDPRAWTTPGQGLLAVVVTDGRHSPVCGAEAWLEGPNGRIDPLVRTDRELIFEAAAGPYRVQARYAGLRAEPQDVTVTANADMVRHPERPAIEIPLVLP